MTTTADPPPSSPSAPGRDKASWRALLLERRRAVPAALRRSEADHLADGVATACASIVGYEPAVVCAYVPTRTEPGSVAMLDALVLRGYRVLLPIVPDTTCGHRYAPPLSWARYLGAESLVAGPWGLFQPGAPDLGPTAVTEAGVVLVPALAVDRSGVRLGRGGGWYDRTLPLADQTAAIVAVVRDEEVVDVLPHEPHDVLMTGVLTPTTGPRTFRPPFL